ncbi:MAG: hypothetical protein ACKVOH_02190 [Chlamydiales bacterium]
MKKIFFYFFISAHLFGLPLNNPKIASLAGEGIFFDSFGYTPPNCWDMLSVRTGYYGDFTFNNYMQLAKDNGSIRCTQIYTNGGEIDVNLWNRVEVYGVLGATKILIHSTLKHFLPEFSEDFSPSINFDIQGESAFSWSVGARGTIWECGRFAIGAEGQYFATNPDINFLRDDYGGCSTYVDGESLSYRSWQGALGITYLIPFGSCCDFYPYLGGVYEGARLKMGDYRRELSALNESVQLLDLKKERNWGYVIGSTLLGGERVIVTAEGRFAYETAFFFSVQMRL